MAEIQEVEKTEMVQGKTVLSLNLPTPKWATWIFRTEFVFNKAALMYLSGTGSIPAEKVKEYILILSIIDFLVWIGGRFLGVKKQTIEDELSV